MKRARWKVQFGPDIVFLLKTALLVCNDGVADNVLVGVPLFRLLADVEQVLVVADGGGQTAVVPYAPSTCNCGIHWTSTS